MTVLIPSLLLLVVASVVNADYTDVANDSEGCTAVDVGDYDLGMHIAALFVILAASAIGVFTPLIFGAQPGRVTSHIFFAFKYFGTGIIISLAYCHLLQDAFETFSNECIGELAFEPTAPAIAMASTLIIWAVDFFGSRWLAAMEPKSVACEPQPVDSDRPVETNLVATMPSQDKLALRDLACCEPGCKPLVDSDRASRRAHWEVQLLEGGIVFHSIMIGVALGAQTDGFSVTFAALVFHQLFEGLGLGARLGALIWPQKTSASIKKWTMCMIYALITPVGVAIGIGVHQSFNENGRAELLAIGVLNSISAGILLYSGLCQLLYAEWVVGDMRAAPIGRVAFASISLILGLFGMTLLGKWT